MRWPEEVNREWLRYWRYAWDGILAEIGTNALLAHMIGDEIGGRYG